MSGRCRGWAGGQRAGSKELKGFLIAVADYANADNFLWPAVQTMADELEMSKRTVQRYLKAAVEAQLLVRLDVEDPNTGRTRSSGYYFPIHGRAPTRAEVSRFEEERGGRVTLVSPWEGDSLVRGEGDTCVMGRVTVVSPPNEPPLEPTGSDEPSPGERAREALFEEIEKAIPAKVIAVSRRGEYRAALDELAADGVDLAEMPARIRRWAADPLFTGRKVPVALERWLRDGQWRGYPLEQALPLGETAAAPAGPKYSAGDGDQALWAKVRAYLRDNTTEAEFSSWIDRSVLAEQDGSLFVVAFSISAQQWIERRCWKRLTACWADVDRARRPLTLTAKSTFEAGHARPAGKAA